MKQSNLIELHKLCTYYNVELAFFTNLNDYGLIEIETREAAQFVHQDNLPDLEKMIRLHHELGINFEGIDTIFHLLEKIDLLQEELLDAQNRLQALEGVFL
ncbi:MAG: chaperone modulator CbpM [Lewinellaceae bacterium]|nr:chaperone modulator CbpM [Saprospiraceae bacterium]MCB9317124.1 chaperone modulator CbpM [Lewinellaceae bacterium]MCB9332713.1 chaperone modulator CbpM [Lewinellaceae bacterium]